MDLDDEEWVDPMPYQLRLEPAVPAFFFFFFEPIYKLYLRSHPQ
jgi:hypothetical protein